MLGAEVAVAGDDGPGVDAGEVDAVVVGAAEDGEAGQKRVSLKESIPPWRTVSVPEEKEGVTACRVGGTLEVMASVRALEAVSWSWRLEETSGSFPAEAKLHFFSYKLL